MSLVVIEVAATAIMVAVAMVVVQMVAAAEHKSGRKRHNEYFKEILVHDGEDRRLSLFMNTAHQRCIFI